MSVDLSNYASSATQRFWAKVERTESCWLWTASLDGSGYGLFKLKTGTTVRAHRWLYTQFKGEIPEGLQLDHICRVRRCVNPAHMEPVTHAENMRRSRRTHCARGHEFTPETTLWMRTCRICASDTQWRRRQEAKAHG